VSPVLIDRALGVAALAAGDDAARQHLADAEDLARRAGMQPELAFILIERGLLERAREGDAAKSITNIWLTEGLHLCEALGMRQHARRVLDAAHTAPSPGYKPKRSQHPAGLSDREVEVLRLVAQGKTNREIAAALMLSEKTVARHMTNIFNKILVENRAGATAFALRHGLA
jgi:DNA-binding NarL/FixJ family response regulator